MAKKKIHIRQKGSSSKPSSPSRKSLKIGLPQDDSSKKPTPNPSSSPKNIDLWAYWAQMAETINFPAHKRLYIAGIGGFLGIIILIVFIRTWNPPSSVQSLPLKSDSLTNNKISVDPLQASFLNQYGLELSQYKLEKRDVFSDTQTPMEVLYGELKLPLKTLQAINQKLPQPSPLNQRFQGMRYSLISSRETQSPEIFIFETSPLDYWVCGIGDSLFVTHKSRSIRTESQHFGGIINHSLRRTLSSRLLLSDELEQQIEEALAWTVDLYHLQVGSKIKFAFKGTYIDGNLHEINSMDAIWLEEGGRKHQLYFFDKEPFKGYFNKEGVPMKTTFLKSPVKYAQVSSRFGLRFHPIAQREKFHYGTDYAAKAGSPIFAVADGKILQAKFRNHNGYYVQIQHSGGYETFYLHMQKNSFPGGIKPGAFVQQGDLIGLVGQTGDATGPHVCFHIRKNDTPIDPLAVDLPQGEPIPPFFLSDYLKKTDSLDQVLAGIRYFQ